MKTEKLITFDTDDFIDDIKDVMASKRFRHFPVLDKEGKYKGLISRRNLLGARGKNVILVDHNERGQAVDGIENANILELIDHHRLGTVETVGPVFFRNQPLGCTGNDHLPDVPRTGAGDRQDHRRSALQCDHLRYASVPFSDLHTDGSGGSGFSG